MSGPIGPRRDVPVRVHLRLVAELSEGVADWPLWESGFGHVRHAKQRAILFPICSVPQCQSVVQVCEVVVSADVKIETFEGVIARMHACDCTQ